MPQWLPHALPTVSLDMKNALLLKRYRRTRMSKKNAAVVILLLFGIAASQVVTQSLGIGRATLVYHVLVCICVTPACLFSVNRRTLSKPLKDAKPILLVVWGTFLLHWILQEMLFAVGIQEARVVTSLHSVGLFGVAFILASFTASRMSRSPPAPTVKRIREVGQDGAE